MFQRHLLLLLLFSVALLTTAHAAMVEVPLKATTAQASDIVQGEVLSQSSDWSFGYKTIYTEITIRVDDSLKGGLQAGQTITLRVEGGEVGETGIWVEHQPRFRDTEKVLLFLKTTQAGHRAVQSLEQGKFTLIDDAAYDFRGQRKSLPEFKTTVRRMIETNER